MDGLSSPVVEGTDPRFQWLGKKVVLLKTMELTLESVIVRFEL